MVSKISSYKAPSYNQGNVSFGKGKVELYSDFDETYCSTHLGLLKDETPATNPFFYNYCENFKKFFHNTAKNLKFHITTGRTLGEYRVASEIIQSRGFELPLPDSIIASCGGDEYIKTGSDDKFYKGGPFPFQSDKTNREKEIALKEKTGWDGRALKEGLKNILEDLDLRIVEAESDTVGDYYKISLFAEDKLCFRYLGRPELAAGFVEGGNSKIFVTYPPDMTSDESRKEIFDTANEKFSDFMKQSGAHSVYTYTSQNKRQCANRVYQVFEPDVEPESVSVYKEYGGLTKLYDPKEAVKRAIKNNDLVVVAGDSPNDWCMMNPLLYIDIPEEARKDGLLCNFDRLKVDYPDEIVDSLNPENPYHRDIIEQLKKMPLVCVEVVNPRAPRRPLEQLADVFGEGSDYQRMVTVELGGLQDGIKEAIKLYSEQNPNFREKLGSDIEKEVYGASTPLKQRILNFFTRK